MRLPEEDGFTLVELLLVVAIMGVIVPALAGIVLVYYRTAFAASVQTDRAFDANLLSAYLQPDLASTRTSPVLSGSGCANTMAVSWAQQNYLPNGNGATDAYVATYTVSPSATGDGPFVLTRTLVVNGVPSGVVRLSHYLDTSCSAVFSTVGTSVVAAVTQSDGSGQLASSVLRFTGSSGGRS
ncbi:MAG: hypothetical protein JWM40_1220 [Frankiales bacterium]|nr:hypothetical protein [Frankiales bacterium]